MHTRLLPFTVGMLLCFGALAQGFAWPWDDNPKKAQANTAQSRQDSVSAVKTTFIDSLNKTNEVGISDNEKLKAPEENPQEKAKTGEAAATLFAVQVVASSQIETIRQEKENLQGKLKLPLFIKNESPYYKLIAGAFPDRESTLPTLDKIKGLGYRDAFIVRVGPLKQE
jgi:hypothetical protein